MNTASYVIDICTIHYCACIPPCIHDASTTQLAIIVYYFQCCMHASYMSIHGHTIRTYLHISSYVQTRLCFLSGVRRKGAVAYNAVPESPTQCFTPLLVLMLPYIQCYALQYAFRVYFAGAMGYRCRVPRFFAPLSFTLASCMHHTHNLYYAYQRSTQLYTCIHVHISLYISACQSCKHASYV